MPRPTSALCHPPSPLLICWKHFSLNSSKQWKRTASVSSAVKAENILFSFSRRFYMLKSSKSETLYIFFSGSLVITVNHTLFSRLKQTLAVSHCDSSRTCPDQQQLTSVFLWPLFNQLRHASITNHFTVCANILAPSVIVHITGRFHTYM